MELCKKLTLCLEQRKRYKNCINFKKNVELIVKENINATCKYLDENNLNNKFDQGYINCGQISSINHMSNLINEINTNKIND